MSPNSNEPSPDTADEHGPPPMTAIPDEEPRGLARPFFAFERAIANVTRALMIASALILGGMLFVQIVMRTAFDSGFLGIEETSTLFGVWIYFLGMGYATRGREHITGGILTLVIKSRKAIKAVRLVGSLTCVAACAIFGYHASNYALFIIDSGRVSLYLHWPRAIWVASILVGFALMIFYFLLQAAAEARDLRKS